MAGKLDYRDFLFSNQQGATLTKEPGNINGQAFTIEDLTDCTVNLFDYTAQITVDMCKNCTMHLGPTEGSVFLRDCHDCTISAACAQFRTKNCSNLTVYLYCSSDPSIEYTKDITFAPYNFSYPQQDQHFQSARLDIGHDLWSQVFDFNLDEQEQHWTIQDPKDFKQDQAELPQFGAPVNPVPRHVSYGGTLTEQVLIGSQNQPLPGMMSFPIIGGDSKAQMEQAQNYFDEQDKNPFQTGPGGSDPFGSNAFGNDPFNQPAQDNLFDSQPPKNDSFNDPFSSQPPQNDPFNSPDPFSSAPPQNNDMFATQPPQGQPQDIFGSTQGQVQGSQPDIFGSQSSSQQKSEDQIKQEQEEQMLRERMEKAQQDLMKKLHQLEIEETEEKEKLRMDARDTLDKWYSDRKNRIEQRRKQNREDEAEYLRKRQEFKQGNPWKKVASMVDFKESSEKAKLVGRMRSVLLAKKNEG